MAKILFIDDDEHIRTLLQEVLQHFQHHVVTAENGAQGLSLMRQFSPDLILMDINMPVKDGYATVAEIRGTPAWAALPVIAVSAAPNEEAQKIKAAGFDHFLLKPVDLMQLCRTIECCLGKGLLAGECSAAINVE